MSEAIKYAVEMRGITKRFGEVVANRNLNIAVRDRSIHAIIGENDAYTPPSDVEELRSLPNVEVVVYPGAEHGFVHDPSRPAHRADDAADAWRRLTLFLA